MENINNVNNQEENAQQENDPPQMEPVEQVQDVVRNEGLAEGGEVGVRDLVAEDNANEVLRRVHVDPQLLDLHAVLMRHFPRRRNHVQWRLPRIRPRYTEAQKRRAVELLDMGLGCRTVAATLGPHCSSGTPIRWRKKFRAADQARLGLAAVIRGAGVNGEPLPNEIQIPQVQLPLANAAPRRQARPRRIPPPRFRGGGYRRIRGAFRF